MSKLLLSRRPARPVDSSCIAGTDNRSDHGGRDDRKPTTLRVYRGANGDHTLYEDGGISQEYLQGRASWTRLTWNDSGKRLTLEPGAPRGATNVPARRELRVVMLPEGTTKTVTYTGQRVQVAFD